MRAITITTLLISAFSLGACRPSTDWSLQAQAVRVFTSVDAGNETTEDVTLEISDSLIEAMRPSDDAPYSTSGVFIQTNFEVTEGEADVDSPVSLVVADQYFGERSVLTFGDLEPCLEDLDDLCRVYVLKRFIAASEVSGTWSATARIEAYGEPGEGTFVFTEDGETVTTTASE